MFGLTNSFGRLPYTVYNASFAQTHNFLLHDVAATETTYRYLDESITPVIFPFGFGLSYSNFSISFDTATATANSSSGNSSSSSTTTTSTTSDSNDIDSNGTSTLGEALVVLFTNGTSPSLNVSVLVHNDGPMAGDVIVQAYMLPPRAYVGVPDNDRNDDTNDSSAPSSSSDDPVIAPRRSMMAYERLRSVGVGTTRQAVFSLNVQDMLIATVVRPAAAAARRRVGAVGVLFARRRCG